VNALLEAARPLLAQAFALWGSPVTWLEILAFVLSVAMVVCNMRVNPLGWPLAMGSSALYALLFASSKLYGEAGLQLFFVAMAVWGWWQWLRHSAHSAEPLPVRRMTPAQRTLALGATALGWPALALLLSRLTDSDVPWMDALPTVASITGTVLLGRKWIENWAVWMGVNLFSLLLFTQKGLWLTVLLYAVFAVMSVAGWRAWRRLQTPAASAFQ